MGVTPECPLWVLQSWEGTPHRVPDFHRRNTSVDENYEWDSEFPGDMELLQPASWCSTIPRLLHPTVEAEPGE